MKIGGNMTSAVMTVILARGKKSHTPYSQGRLLHVNIPVECNLFPSSITYSVLNQLLRRTYKSPRLCSHLTSNHNPNLLNQFASCNTHRIGPYWS